ncbi:hypothetical protein G2W53_011581 [Senna tora]|uniref:Uncharacterized protein n=1 Tax=Senna tora TaxID=362788 RepID=A0A834X1R2_9FABA|nr:hypothetical protein G2W53_011581 [Senna tora]
MVRVGFAIEIGTCIDKTSSALASGAGTARDSLDPFLSGSCLCPLLPAAPCTYSKSSTNKQNDIIIKKKSWPSEFTSFFKADAAVPRSAGSMDKRVSMSANAGETEIIENSESTCASVNFSPGCEASPAKSCSMYSKTRLSRNKHTLSSFSKESARRGNHPLIASPATAANHEGHPAATCSPSTAFGTLPIPGC